MPLNSPDLSTLAHRDNSMMHRRSFIVRSGLALAAAGSTAGHARGQPEQVDVAIVGGGLAGLTAAMTLREQGVGVVVLEGSGRAGGRVQTADSYPGHPDLGGVQIGPMYARVRNLARRLKVPLAPGAHVNAPYCAVVGGTLIAAKDWASSPLNRLEGAERRVPPHALSGFFVEQRSPFTALDDWLAPDAARYDISLGQWLRDQKASPEAQRIVQATQGATPLDEIALLRMFQEATRSKFDFKSIADRADLAGKDVFERFAITSSHVVGGSNRLIEAVQASLGDALRLQHRVTRIEQRNGRCTVRCANGNQFSARRVICAAPFSVLRKVAMDPVPPQVQAEAISQMPYSNQSQVWLRVLKPYWEDDGLEASMWSDGPFTLIRQQIEGDGSRQLVSVLSFGPNSNRIDAMPEAERGRYALDYLAKIRPSMAGKLEVLGVHSWRLMPLIAGCSHQYRPGRAFDWAREMVKPHIGIHFAGEHTRRLEVGMESAMESGDRTALEVLEALA